MRLIDGDEFKKQIAGMAIINNYPADKANKICELIDCQPTAYDVDKVVQKITELQLKIKDKSLEVEDEEYAVMPRGQLRGIADCLEIVKSCGVTND